MFKLLLTLCWLIPIATINLACVTPMPADTAESQPAGDADSDSLSDEASAEDEVSAEESEANEAPPGPADPAGRETAGQANADVTFVKASQSSDGAWRFDVTVAHPDTGWEDYADGWDVVLPDGTVLKRNADDPFTRLLLHPHETEQPFTRSQSGLEIPAGVTTVTVRAHDLVDGWGGQEVTVDLTQSSGPAFEVTR